VRAGAGGGRGRTTPDTDVAVSWARRARGLLPALLVVAAGLFVVGVAAERSDDHHESAATAAEPNSHVQREAATQLEGGEGKEAANAVSATCRG
jgi:hypothetical protein